MAAMIRLGRQLHAESRFRQYPYDEQRLAVMGRRSLSTSNPVGIMAERDGELIGMAVVTIGEHFFSATRTATVMLIYVAHNARGGVAAVKLLRAMRHWSTQAGADEMHVNVTSDIEARKTDRMLRRMGFRPTGGNYVLERLQS